MQSPFLTSKEVAELLKLNIETVYDLIAKHGLPATKLGGSWRFDAEELREWFRTHRDQPAGTGPKG